jgi:hypothetical protein
MPRKTNTNLPDDIIQMSFQDWTDPVFLRENLEENEEPNNYVIVNGKRVLANTTLNELGLALTENNVYSDPGEYNAVSPLAIQSPSEKISRSHAMPKHKRSAKKTAKRNNRFGFKKAFGTLTRGLKKLTGRSRKNRRN